MEGRNIEQPTFEDLELLAEVSQLLTVVELENVLQKVVSLAARSMGASKVSLFLQEGDTVDWEHLITTRNLPPDQSVKVVTQVMGTGFAGWVYKNKRGDIIVDTETDDRWLVFPDDPILTRSVLCVPFLYENEVIALITLTHENPNHFKLYHLRLMEIVTNQAAVAIRNAQLFNRLNAQRRQLHVVLQSISDALVVLDAAGKIEMVNVTALPIFGANTPEQVIGHTILDFLLVDAVFRPIIEIIQAGLTHPDNWHFETRSERRQVDYLVTMGVWEEVQRQRRGYVIIMHDVTILRDLSRFKDEILQVASYDLRSPLALINGYADMIRMDLSDPDSPIHEHVEIIKNSVESMGSLVEDVLRVERIRSTPLELHEHTDMAALIRVVIVNARPAAQAKYLQFNTDVQLDGIPRIVVDPVLIRQAMENLIDNAIKYTPEGRRIVVQVHYDADRFYFSVEDDGIGIPQEHQPYVFEAFYRVEQTRYKEKGSGLGLSMVKNVIARHNGEVWVKSIPDKGSRFGFWLPLIRQLSEKVVQAPDPSAGDE